MRTLLLRYMVSAVVLSLVVGCGGERASLDIRANGWPDGTSIGTITPGTPRIRTTIYGGRARLNPASTTLRLTITHPSMLTALTDTFTTDDAADTIQLPAPVARRRFGSWRLGIAFNHSAADSFLTVLCERAPLAFTTISLDHSPSPLVTIAHDNAVECLLSAENLPSTIIEDAERGGFDGIVTDYDSITAGDRIISGYETVREHTRERGITVTVRVEILSADGMSRLDNIAAWYMGLPVGERPDELRLAFRGDADVPVVSAERIEEMVAYLTGRGIPMREIAVDIAPTAMKYRVTGDGTLEHTVIQPGEVAFLFAIVSGTPGARLRDGSLRIGNRGDLFVVEDTESLVGKVSRLRSGPLSTSAGVHLTCDEYGVIIDADDMVRIAEAVSAPEPMRSP